MILRILLRSPVPMDIRMGFPIIAVPRPITSPIRSNSGQAKTYLASVVVTLPTIGGSVLSLQLSKRMFSI